jgi:calcium binding protein 39
MPCGGVLREALKYDAIAALILYDEPTPDGKGRNLQEVDTAAASSGKGVFWKFFDWIVKSSFEICADAFSTFRVCCSSSLPYLSSAINVKVGNPHATQAARGRIP